MLIPFSYDVVVNGWGVATVSGRAEIIAGGGDCHDTWRLSTISLDATKLLAGTGIRSGVVQLPYGHWLTNAISIWLLGEKRAKLDAAWTRGSPLVEVVS